jgi:hypothetical protein
MLVAQRLHNKHSSGERQDPEWSSRPRLVIVFAIRGVETSRRIPSKLAHRFCGRFEMGLSARTMMLSNPTKASSPAEQHQYGSSVLIIVPSFPPADQSR